MLALSCALFHFLAAPVFAAPAIHTIEDLASKLNCGEVPAKPMAGACTTDSTGLGDLKLLESGPIAKSCENQDSARSEKAFLEQLKARVLLAQVQHMAFRDGIDLNTGGDAWATATRIMEGTSSTSVLNIDPKCTRPYPDADLARTRAVSELFKTGPAATRRNAHQFAALEQMIMEGVPSDSEVCSEVPAVCLPLGERALIAKKLSAETSRQSQMELEAILTADPALYELVPAEGAPDGCQKRRHSPGTCEYAFEQIAGYEQIFMGIKPATGATEAEQARYDAQNRVMVSNLQRPIYETANRSMKTRIANAISLTCKSDGSDLVLVFSVVAPLLSDPTNLGCKETFCRVYNRKKAELKSKEDWIQAMNYLGYGGMALGTLAALATIPSGTGAAFLPWLAVLSTTSGGAFTTKAAIELRDAPKEIARSTVKVGAGMGNPKELADAETKSDQARADFERELKTLAATTSFDGAMAALSSMRALRRDSLAQLKTLLAKLVKDGKYTEEQAATLISQASRSAKVAEASAQAAREASVEGSGFFRQLWVKGPARLVGKEVPTGNEQRVWFGVLRTNEATPPIEFTWTTAHKRIFQAARNLTQAPAHAVTKVVMGKAHDFTPFRAAWEAAERVTLGPGKEFAMPAKMVLYSTVLAKFNLYALADEALSEAEKSKLRHELDRLVETDYRFREIKQELDIKQINREEARKKAADLAAIYKAYYAFMENLFKEGKTHDSREVTNYVLTDEEFSPVADELFRNLRIYRSPKFWQRTDFKFTGSIKDVPSKTHELALITHEKLYLYAQAPKWFGQEKIPTSGPEREIYDSIANDDFTKKLIAMNRSGKISRDRLVWLITEDTNWKTRFLEWNAIGAVPLKQGADGKRNVPYTLDDVRRETLAELPSDKK